MGTYINHSVLNFERVRIFVVLFHFVCGDRQVS